MNESSIRNSSLTDPNNSVEIALMKFNPASGFYYPGDRATSSLTIRNTGRKRWTFWIGCSVQDKCGTWYDIPSHPITLSPGQISASQEKSWIVPVDPTVISGSFNVRMAVWTGRPEDGTALRLGYVQKDAAFSAFNFSDHFSLFSDSRWIKGNHRTPGTVERPGLGWFQPKNVAIDQGKLMLKHPANTKNGGEIASKNTYTYGTFRTSMKCPALPGTISTLFTYQGVDYGDEIDMEIWNDGSRKVIFTLWKFETSSVTGRAVYSNTIVMDFDPSQDFHEYRIDYYPGAISWYIDGILKDKTTVHAYFPNHPMYLYINTWWPNWPGWEKYTSLSSDQFAEYHAIMH